MFKIQTHYKVAAVFLFILAISVLSGGKAHAASFVVNSTADDPDTTLNGTCADDINGDCTLRAAIQEVNDIGDPSNTISIPAGTITLADHLTFLTAPVTIEGDGMGQTIIDGDGQWQGMRSGAAFTGSGFTVTGSLDFGLLLNGGGQLDSIEVNGVNWGVTDPGGVVAGIVTGNSTVNDISVLATNIYIHGFNVDVQQFIGFGATGGQTNDVTVSVSNITISDITNTGMVHSMTVMAGLFDGGASTGGINADIKNATVTNITSLNSIVSGLLTAGATQNTITFSVNVENSTFINLSGGGTNPFLSGFSNGAVFASAGGAVNSITTNVTLSNLLIADNDISDCGTGNINDVYGMSGTVTNNITSLGGNVTDTSCSHFTHPTDQNNVANVASTVSPLADNGGSVPTMALLQGSPAIDSGVTIAGLTTDGRQAVRPQGSAYDSGAYESPYTKPASASLASTGQSQTLYVLVALADLTICFGLILKRRT
ncbi:hypothetical protein KBD20_03335 [Candidatus Saccharibacteria bacterium]|nr:hypothetical protein [Candidatus Saccharibacteria bacterium]